MVPAHLEDVLRAEAVKLRQGQHRIACPECAHTRKRENQTQKTLSVAVRPDGKATFHCWHCGLTGLLTVDERARPGASAPRTARLPGRPAPAPKANATTLRSLFPPPPGTLSPAARRWLQDERRIDPDLAERCGVSSELRYVRDVGRETECVVFRYPTTPDRRTGSVKFRALQAKAFSAEGPADTLYLSDRIGPGARIVICEGELDALAMLTAGVPNAVSVPAGASQPKAPATSATTAFAPPSPARDNPAYLASIEDALGLGVIIATDGDAPGRALGDELARRIGRERCWRVTWPDDCKDASDVLIRHGREALRTIVQQAAPWPVPGLSSALDFEDAVMELYRAGWPKGFSTGFRDVDHLFRLYPGHLTVVTGTPGSGKSEFVDQLCVSMAQSAGWRWAMCSFENPPHEHVIKLVEKRAKTPFFEGPAPRLTEDEVSVWMAWVNEHFYFLDDGDGSVPATIESILERTRVAILRHGVRGLVIDPYNYLDTQADGNRNEARFVQDMLARVKRFCMMFDMHCFFIAHPQKLQRIDGARPIPTGYDISGSAGWFDKPDLGLTVSRPKDAPGVSQIDVWKCRWKRVGQIGTVRLAYDPASGTYSDTGWHVAMGTDPDPPPPPVDRPRATYKYQ